MVLGTCGLKKTPAEAASRYKHEKVCGFESVPFSGESQNNIKIKKPRKPEQPQTLKALVGKHRGLGARICPQGDETRASKENKFLKIQPNCDVAPNCLMRNLEICKQNAPAFILIMMMLR